MLIPTDSTSNAGAQVDVELDLHCAACGVSSSAWVRGRSLPVVGPDATFLAEVEAQRDAAAIIRLAQCPRCGTHDPRELRAVAKRFGWSAAGVATFVLALGALSDPLRALAACWPLLAGAWALQGGSLYMKLRGAKTRVRFNTAATETCGPYRSTR